MKHTFKRQVLRPPEEGRDLGGVASPRFCLQKCRPDVMSPKNNLGS